MTPQLSDSHNRTYECISRHPAVRNPGWLDVQWMPRPLAEVALAAKRRRGMRNLLNDTGRVPP
ncbi:MAG TPA: hypothetical protein VIL39_01905 [Verrucomicrobiae bacterium]